MFYSCFVIIFKWLRRGLFQMQALYVIRLQSCASTCQYARVLLSFYGTETCKF